MKMADLLAGDGMENVTPEHEFNFAEAIEYWYNLIANIKEQAGVVNVNKIVNSAGFFGYVVVACLSDYVITPARSVALAKRILKNSEKMVKICPELCRGDRSDINRYCRLLKDIFRLKKAKAA